MIRRFVTGGKAWQAFEVVKEFVYLGSLMPPTNDVSLEMQRRIQTANRCFYGMRKHLSHQTKFTIHKTLIRPVLLYGSKTWVLTKREETELLVLERKVLRMICGPKNQKWCLQEKVQPRTR
jgi:hypothetical protein